MTPVSPADRQGRRFLKKNERHVTQFKFDPKLRTKSGRAEGPVFTIDRLWTENGPARKELSHLMDRSYGYRSERELRWHLAERFSLPVSAVALSRA